MRYFEHMQSVLHDRCASWQPFAPISYHTNDTTGNPYTCVKVVDEKNIMRGMIATDMLISAAEGVLSSYLALTLFIIKTRAGSSFRGSATLRCSGRCCTSRRGTRSSPR